MVAEILLNDGHPFGLCPNHSSAAQPCMILDWDVATIFAIKICVSIQTLMGGVPLLLRVKQIHSQFSQKYTVVKHV